MFSNNYKIFIKLFLFTLFFSFLIFTAKNYFFGGREIIENNIIEEKYIEPVLEKMESEEFVNYNITSELSSAAKFKYTFLPEEFFFSNEIKPYLNSMDSFLNYNTVESKINFLEIFLNKEKGEVRGKMKNKSLILFGVLDMNVGEFLSVSIHEFGHFLDLYILEKKVSYDISDYFYNISWENTTTIKAGLEQKDFVSGYSMTNKYEDFAESFNYYILHNYDFLEKTLDSEILKQKYNFFSKYVFRNDEFKTNNYKITKEIKLYYRDTTKIEFSLENFLQYLKK